MEIRIEKIRCKRCGSTQTYYRIKTKDRYCRMCSYVEDLSKKGNEEE